MTRAILKKEKSQSVGLLKCSCIRNNTDKYGEEQNTGQQHMEDQQLFRPEHSSVICTCAECNNIEMGMSHGCSGRSKQLGKLGGGKKNQKQKYGKGKI